MQVLDNKLSKIYISFILKQNEIEGVKEIKVFSYTYKSRITCKTIYLGSYTKIFTACCLEFFPNRRSVIFIFECACTKKKKKRFTEMKP